MVYLSCSAGARNTLGPKSFIPASPLSSVVSFLVLLKWVCTYNIVDTIDMYSKKYPSLSSVFIFLRMDTLEIGLKFCI